MDWPDSRNTWAAASRALSFLCGEALAGFGSAAASGVELEWAARERLAGAGGVARTCRAAGAFLAGSGAAWVERFFFAVMGTSPGAMGVIVPRRADRDAASGQEDYLGRGDSSRQFQTNCGGFLAARRSCVRGGCVPFAHGEEVW